MRDWNIPPCFGCAHEHHPLPKTLAEPTRLALDAAAMSFHVGQKVVCVDASNIKKSFRSLPNRPVKGSIYTVREIYEDSIYLEEIVNPSDVIWKNGDVGEGSFMAHRFRPIVSRKTDIAIFKRMLLPQGVDA